MIKPGDLVTLADSPDWGMFRVDRVDMGAPIIFKLFALEPPNRSNPGPYFVTSYRCTKVGGLLGEIYSYIHRELS